MISKRGTHGGKRKGAGRKKGFRFASTLTKEAAREAFRVEVQKHLPELIAAQIDNAKGLKYLVTRDAKTGKFINVTEAMARAKPGEETIEVWEKDPNVNAFAQLMDRTLDRPAEQKQQHSVSGKLVIEWGE